MNPVDVSRAMFMGESDSTETQPSKLYVIWILWFRRWEVKKKSLASQKGLQAIPSKGG